MVRTVHTDSVMAYTIEPTMKSVPLVTNPLSLLLLLFGSANWSLQRNWNQCNRTVRSGSPGATDTGISSSNWSIWSGVCTLRIQRRWYLRGHWYSQQSGRWSTRMGTTWSPGSLSKRHGWFWFGCIVRGSLVDLLDLLLQSCKNRNNELVLLQFISGRFSIVPQT